MACLVIKSLDLILQSPSAQKFYLWNSTIMRVQALHMEQASLGVHPPEPPSGPTAGTTAAPQMPEIQGHVHSGH